MSDGKIKVLDGLGRIVLPKYQRKLLGWNANDAIKVTTDEKNGRMILQKADIVCLKCGSGKNLKKITAYQYLCKTCLDILQKE